MPTFFLNKSVCSLIMHSLLQNFQYLSNLLTLLLFLGIGLETKKIIIDQQIFCQLLPKYLQNRFEGNLQIVLITFYQTSNVVKQENGKKQKIKRFSELSSLSCPKHSIAFSTISSISSIPFLHDLFNFFSSLKINTGLSLQPQAENKISYVLQYLGGNFIWRPTQFNFGTIFIQYFLV